MKVNVDAWTTVSNEGSAKESYEFEKKPDVQTIRVPNPNEYEEGQKVEVKVIKNYEKDVWDIDRLKFEVEKIN
ncbi:hypothetical protein CEH05_08315 [Halobacillus halophilus]|uniref:Uncharacterized protein n=1 Tax=Halobacillus halophilus (strain ATCC 35676 / DSM 2266 / JCM 20832 / KCTC 3685 / LMG 17431 / NBRC 102448 / NCIMB 2269) TaxID=866895 RepID=I0JLI7_HALH3|nr:hypothetical protein [Halobacillus halophilus]ASF39120.1 hypothetical protein CEH05_08315 [Halobacillus halophilus]CCG45007.1 hypothetical protein HBHAL_2657 [Halobacillus halophilus DSM 2266]